MGTSDDDEGTPTWDAITGDESDELREAKHYEMMFRLGYLKALDLVTRSMYQNRWKGWGQ